MLVSDIINVIENNLKIMPLFKVLFRLSDFEDSKELNAVFAVNSSVPIGIESELKANSY